MQETPLLEAACYGQVEIVKFLISNGADLEAIDKDGKTPLMKAIDCDWCFLP